MEAAAAFCCEAGGSHEDSSVFVSYQYLPQRVADPCGQRAGNTSYGLKVTRPHHACWHPLGRTPATSGQRRSTPLRFTVPWQDPAGLDSHAETMGGSKHSSRYFSGEAGLFPSLAARPSHAQNFATHMKGLWHGANRPHFSVHREAHCTGTIASIPATTHGKGRTWPPRPCRPSLATPCEARGSGSSGCCRGPRRAEPPAGRRPATHAPTSAIKPTFGALSRRSLTAFLLPSQIG